MPSPTSAMEVFKHLDKSNCRECGEKTCLAFAGAVYQSRKAIGRCPRLAPDIVDRFSGTIGPATPGEEMGAQLVADLKDQVVKTDYSEAARRTGGALNRSKLKVKILGKDFCVDSTGNLSSDIHINPFIVAPFFNYVLHCKGREPDGEWVSFRELEAGKDFSYPFFQKRCERVMKKVADKYTDLFDDLVHIFNGRKVSRQFESDVSVVLYLLPKVPMMICYWKPEDGLDSTLNLFFDKSADENLAGDSLFTLCVGLARMFEKLSQRHAGTQTRP